MAIFSNGKFIADCERKNKSDIFRKTNIVRRRINDIDITHRFETIIISIDRSSMIAGCYKCRKVGR